MKTILIILLSFCIAYTLQAQNQQVNSEPVYYFGQIKSSQKLSDSLRVVFWKDFIYEMGIVNTENFFVQLGADNTFNFKIPAFEKPGRLLLNNGEIGMLFDFQLIEPGDSIYVMVNHTGYDAFDASFYGKGSDKYNVMRKVNAVASAYNLPGMELPLQVVQRYDSLLTDQLNILYSVKPNVKDHIFQILKADVIGQNKKRKIEALASRFSSADSLRKKDFEIRFNTMLSGVDKSGISDYAIAQSKNYIEYLYWQSKTQLVYQNSANFSFNDLFKSTDITFKDLYEVVKNKYEGILREKLLTYMIANFWEINTFFLGVDANEFTACINDALNIVSAPYLKFSVQKQLDTIGKGAVAFDFTLTDIDGARVSLHDFRGKVVLIDMWANPCTGCLVFKKEFEAKVYPELKDNPDFEVISINLNTDKKRWLDGIKKYSHSEFINLYTDGLGKNHPLPKHYNITGIPYLLLVDKKGRVVSATVPFTSRGKDLLALIQEVLSKPQ